MILLQDRNLSDITLVLDRYGLELVQLASATEIPGSYWGESEAGLIGNRLYVRLDTPLHSLLHEACHFICMDEARRTGLNKDAGGDYDEENAVCYLQIVLADYLPRFDRKQMWADMDAWGYTFRLGSARAWFEGDAQDTHEWLMAHGLIDREGRPTWRCRY
ncbi:hypothetical protein HNQ60_003144 [Povalibacter uvarum]|uniref:IrrE N-terminal-like domain-containing protein n=1 Tax=Povalibacter uvarum TaxID=732238 RepID=A0A841HND5_9GAMM|nr:hypothetical protein [Povalibacter uvarum]MBB6094263.1 hypothetical protein [Povalibacter uvarum]